MRFCTGLKLIKTKIKMLFQEYANRVVGHHFVHPCREIIHCHQSIALDEEIKLFFLCFTTFTFSSPIFEGQLEYWEVK